jgi:hypothetical protein
MRRILSALVVLGLCCGLQVVTGCGKGENKTTRASGDTKETDEPEAKWTAVDYKDTATIKGKATLDGMMPSKEPIKALMEHKDCKGIADADPEDKVDQTWLVSDDKAVRDVVVWVTPAKEKGYFKLPESARNLKEQTEKLHQPHCAFRPHVLALFPYYRDGDDEKPTGQKLLVENDAKFSHNTKITSNDDQRNPVFNTGLLPPGNKKTHAFRPQSDPLNVMCDIHPFMRAKIWVFDNPFHAVTKKDGAFEIKGVPAGVEIVVHVWHDDSPSSGEQKMTLKKDETKEMDLKVKRK